MSNVISFAAVRDARRADAETASREAAAEARRERERADIADRLGGTLGAQIIADVVTGLKAKEEAARTAFVPAYCDPGNETRGAKYEATRHLPPREISARIRADIKEAQKAGRIDRAAKVSVRMESYSGGWSVDVRVTALPPGFRVTSESYAAWVKQFGPDRRPPMAWRECRSEQYHALMDALEDIRGAYNRDNSDSTTDYFDVRYYGSTSIDWRAAEPLEASEIDAAPADTWLVAE